MKYRIKEHVYEVTVDGVVRYPDIYETSQLALESAMNDIFETMPNSMWLTKPVLWDIAIENIDHWRVSVMRGTDDVVRTHTIAIHRMPVLTRS